MQSQRVLTGVVMAFAVVVLIAGIAAALTKDDGSEAATGATSTSTTSSLLTTTTARTTTTVAPAPTTTTAPGTTTTARPGPTTTTTTVATVGSPEATANGLMAAYQAGDRTQAERFAVRSVVDVLFEQPFTGSTPQFRGCTPSGADFDCEVDQTDSTYRMTVRRQANGTFLVEFIDIQGTGAQPATTTTTTTASSTG